MEHLFDEKSNTPGERAAAPSNNPELGSLAFRKSGNKCTGAPVFTKPWSGTTDMQARPGARRWSDFAQVSDHGILILALQKMASAPARKRPVSCAR
jgi:hypothetical protein